MNKLNIIKAKFIIALSLVLIGASAFVQFNAVNLYASPGAEPIRAVDSKKSGDKLDDKKSAEQNKPLTPIEKVALEGNDVRGVIPLVVVDSDEQDWINNAVKAIKAKKYSRAVKILQILIEKKQPGYYLKNRNLFYSIRKKASRILSMLPEEALAEYRLEYNPIARKKFKDAAQSGDVGKLREIVSIYANTDVASEVTEYLANHLFDRGDVLSAARYWVGMGELKNAEDMPRAAKIASCYYIAGKTSQAEAYVKIIRKRFPEATAKFGGKEQKLLDFLADIKKIKPIQHTKASVITDCYPGWGGLESSFVSQAPVDDIVLMPRWAYPKMLGRVDGSFDRHMIARDATSSLRSTHSRNTCAAMVDGNAVLFPNGYNKGSHKRFRLPGVIQPVSNGKELILRTDYGVVSLDMYSGDVIWKAPLPIRKYGTPGAMRSQYNTFVDRDMYSLTIGGGKVFALGGFSVPARRRYNQKSTDNFSNQLAAFSIKRQGAAEWILGGAIKMPSTGDEDFDDYLAGVIYLSAPAYYENGSQSRLYVNTFYLETYYLLCLDAKTGKPLWRRQVAQPTAATNNYASYIINFMRMVGTPPVCKDGMVYVATNAGVVACFDAENGTPEWAHQYSSTLANNYSWRSFTEIRGNLTAQGMRNPIIIAKDKLVYKPADLNALIILNRVDGKRCFEHQVSTGFCNSMIGIDSSRVALTGEGIKIISVETGDVIKEFPKMHCTAGRPILAGRELVASGSGYILKLNIDNYKSISVPIADPTASLGNLLSVDGKLFAVNPLGVSAYFKYETAYDVLTQRYNKLNVPGDQIDLLQKRAYLSYGSGKYQRAKDDYDQALEIAKKVSVEHHKKLERDLKHKYYSIYVALANNSKTDAKMFENLSNALALADSRGVRALMKIRLAKYYVKTGKYEQAIELAHEVANNYGDCFVQDIPLGKKGNQVFELRQLPQILGRDWAFDVKTGFVTNLVKTKGDKIYAKFNAKAKADLDQAVKTGDPTAIESVRTRWPMSKWAQNARLETAAAYFNIARESVGTQASSNIAQAQRIISEIILEKADLDEDQRSSDAVYVTAKVAMLALLKTKNQKYAVDLLAEEFEDYETDQKINFAGIKGDLASVVQQIMDGKHLVAREVPKEIMPAVRAPLRLNYKIGDIETVIIRNTEGKPLTLGNMVFIQQGDKTYLIDPTAGSEEQAIKLGAITRVSHSGFVSPINRFRYKNGDIWGAIHPDGKSAVIGNRIHAAAFEIKTGKVLWYKRTSEFGKNLPGRSFNYISVGARVIVFTRGNGMVYAVDTKTGKLKWAVSMPRTTQGHPSYISDTPTVTPNCVIVKANNGGSIYGYSIKTGKMVFRFDSQKIRNTGRIGRNDYFNRQVYYQVTKTGLLKIFARGKLYLFRLSGVTSVTKPFATIPLPKLTSCKWGPASDNYTIILNESFRSNKCEIVVADHKTKRVKRLLVKTKTGRNTRQSLTTNMEMAGNDLYVTAGVENGYFSDRRSLRKNASGVKISKYSLKTGKLIWTRKYPAKSGNIHHTYLQICQKKLVFGVANNDITDAGSRLYVVNRKTGKLEDTVYFGKRNGKKVNDILRRKNDVLGNFIVLDGAICTDDMDGVTVHTGK